METVEIRLTKGKITVVDSEDFERVSQFSWHCARRRGIDYASAIIQGKTVLLHRFITHATKGFDVDHRDANGLNNSRSNLRVCTRSQNIMNGRKLQTGTSSRYKGVSIKNDHPRTKPWRAYIKIQGKTQTLGSYKTEEEAAIAYNEKAKELFGEFARLNEVQ